MENLNVLIIGSGHYSTGLTSISSSKETDKDNGVLLPSILALKDEGGIGIVAVAARNGDKLQSLKPRLERWNREYGWSKDVSFFPGTGEIKEDAYLDALKSIPKPCVALIAVPDSLHRKVILDCIEYGVHFLIVKPAVTSLKDYYHVAEKLKSSDVFGMVDYHKVFDEANLMIKGDYEAGLYGRIHHIHSIMTQKRDMLDIFDRWLVSNNPPNINHYLGSHYIHMVGYITKATPIDVRALSQSGVASKKFNDDNIKDIIETQIRWVDESGHCFTSYHVSGWIDPSETESMTYQEMHLLTEKARVTSDQRDRGLRMVITEKGYSAPNPYFFNFVKHPSGKLNLKMKYGYDSVKSFLDAIRNIVSKKEQGAHFDFPTFIESERVTAILDAADMSLANNSAVVKMTRENGQFVLSL